MTDETIAPNLSAIRARIASAAERAGRNPESITLVAVTKTVEPHDIAEAYRCGVRDFGENYVQEAVFKQADELGKCPDIRWHLIGHLQKNKVKDVVGRFALVQSVDSETLAGELSRHAQRFGTEMDILLQVKLDRGETKTGIAPEQLLQTAETVNAMAGLRLCGLMGMAPYAADPEASRPFFQELRQIFVQLPPDARRILSMGMTGDFEVGIEEGATMVRVGTGIFGPRPGAR